MKDVSAAGNLEPDRGVFRGLGGVYAGLGYSSGDTAEFQQILGLVRCATDAAFAHSMQAVAQGFLDRIKHDNAACSSLYEYGIGEGNYADASFLHYIDPHDFAKALIHDSAVNGLLFACLSERYQNDRHNRVLTDEYSWVKGLRAALDLIAQNAEPPHRRVLELRLDQYFDKINAAIGG